MRQQQGQNIGTVPVVTSNPLPATAGIDLTQLTNKTEKFKQDSPAKLAIYVPLSGGTSVMLTLWLHDPEFGWSQAGDTGNLGLLGGQALPSSPGQYVFLVQNAGIFDQMLLVASNNVGGVSVGNVVLVEYIERSEDRKQ